MWQRLNSCFTWLAACIAEQGGRAWFFVLNIVAIVGSGAWFNWSSDWQLWMTTALTVLNWQFMILVLMVQSRDMKALQLKDDELIRAIPAARDMIAAAEDMEEGELDRLKEQAKSEIRSG